MPELETLKPGDEVHTRNGWHYIVREVKMWDHVDGEVYGVIVRGDGSHSDVQYIGTLCALIQNRKQ